MSTFYRGCCPNAPKHQIHRSNLAFSGTHEQRQVFMKIHGGVVEVYFSSFTIK
jgi:hypothetical protein